MAFIFVKVLAPVFLSRGDTKTPVKVGVIAMVSNVVLNVLFAYYYAHVGLAVATSISALINASFLYYYLNKDNIYTVCKNFKKMLFKVLTASFIMIIFILLFNLDIQTYLEMQAFSRIVSLTSVIVPAALIYFVSLKILGVTISRL